ncbi:hypothetical protein ABG067_009422, partial [Albugo candida]
MLHVVAQVDPAAIGVGAAAAVRALELPQAIGFLAQYIRLGRGRVVCDHGVRRVAEVDLRGVAGGVDRAVQAALDIVGPCGRAAAERAGIADVQAIEIVRAAELGGDQPLGL